MRAFQLHLRNRILICWVEVLTQAWTTYAKQVKNETEIEFSLFFLSD